MMVDCDDFEYDAMGEACVNCRSTKDQHDIKPMAIPNNIDVDQENN